MNFGCKHPNNTNCPALRNNSSQFAALAAKFTKTIRIIRSIRSSFFFILSLSHLWIVSTFRDHKYMNIMISNSIKQMIYKWFIHNVVQDFDIISEIRVRTRGVFVSVDSKFSLIIPSITDYPILTILTLSFINLGWQFVSMNF